MALRDYLERKPVLETPRLVLRPLVPSDAESMAEWTRDPSLYEHWGKGPGRTDRDPRLLFARPPRPAKSFHLGLACRETGKIVGEIWVYLVENDRMAKVALRLARTHRGRGLGTESLSAMVRFCFEKTELRRLWTDVDVRNAASARMLEKCGFRREGLVRQGKMVNTWCDYFLYGMLREDFERRERRNAARPAARARTPGRSPATP